MDIYYVLVVSILLMANGLHAAEMEEIPENVLEELSTDVEEQLEEMEREDPEEALEVKRAMAQLLSEKDPECTFTRETDLEVDTKKFLDVIANDKCNNPLDDIYGVCNCPEGHMCGADGDFAEEKVYYCELPPKPEYFRSGLFFGEGEDGPPTVQIEEGVAALPVDPEYSG